MIVLVYIVDTSTNGPLLSDTVSPAILPSPSSRPSPSVNPNGRKFMFPPVNAFHIAI